MADYQASALLMAIVLNGMTPRETTDLTLAMANSGHMLDLSDVVDLAVDKHSSGGVGDKTSLAVLPIVAASGLPVGKMSGRGLGFSGGTLDKLESIPGYRVDLTTEEFKHQLKEKGIVLTGQSLDLAPADGAGTEKSLGRVIAPRIVRAPALPPGPRGIDPNRMKINLAPLHIPPQLPPR